MGPATPPCRKAASLAAGTVRVAGRSRHRGDPPGPATPARQTPIPQTPPAWAPSARAATSRPSTAQAAAPRVAGRHARALPVAAAPGAAPVRLRQIRRPVPPCSSRRAHQRWLRAPQARWPTGRPPQHPDCPAMVAERVVIPARRRRRRFRLDRRRPRPCHPAPSEKDRPRTGARRPAWGGVTRSQGEGRPS